MPGATLVSARPFYHILLKMSSIIFSSKCTKNLSALGGQIS